MKTLPPERIVYVEHPSDIIARAADIARAGGPLALITSLAIEGGAAREVGSLAMVDADGEMTGYLSNGCIDRDIQHHARDALHSGRKKVIRYGEGSRYAGRCSPTCCGSGAVRLSRGAWLV